MSKIEQAVIEKIIQRAELGKQKYGVTMECTDLDLAAWLQHLQDELLDAAVYTQKLIELNQNLSSQNTVKPSWDDAPKWTNFLTCDDDGLWKWHEEKPFLVDGSGCWHSTKSVSKYCPYFPEWKTSLEQRPQ